MLEEIADLTSRILMVQTMLKPVDPNKEGFADISCEFQVVYDSL